TATRSFFSLRRTVFLRLLPPPPHSTLFPYTTLFRSQTPVKSGLRWGTRPQTRPRPGQPKLPPHRSPRPFPGSGTMHLRAASVWRSEEHTSELQSPCNLVCRLLLEKKKEQHL